MIGEGKVLDTCWPWLWWYKPITERLTIRLLASQSTSYILTHWGRVTHICVSKLTTIGSDNGLSPGRRQAIIWTNDGILLIRTLGTNFSEILSEIHSFSFQKMYLKMSSVKWRLFRLGLNELSEHGGCRKLHAFLVSRDLQSAAWLAQDYLEGWVQDCSNSIANALELLQSCTKPSI